MMMLFRIQTEIECLGIREVELFTDETSARERYNSLVKSADENGLSEQVEIIFDTIERDAL